MTPPYPQASEAVDNALFSAIEGLRASMDMGFTRVEGQIKDMVTKGEFNATIQRLDSKDDQLDAKMDTGFKDMELKVASGFQEVKDADKERNTKNRWFWTLLVSFAGVLSGCIFGIISLITR
jgi:hypothetical protein